MNPSQASFYDIIIRTPPQVWAILAVITLLGLMQLRERAVKETNLMLTPLAMLGLSLYTVYSNFGFTGWSLGPWFAAFGIAFAINAVILRSPARATYDATTQKFIVAGSVIPLLVMLAIFASNYILGVTRAITPATLADPTFRMQICATLGVLSGILFARSVRIAKAKKRAESPSIA